MCKEIDYKWLNVLSKIKQSVVTVKRDSYTVERIIKQKTTDKISNTISLYLNVKDRHIFNYSHSL